MGHPVLRQVAAPVPVEKIKTPEFRAFLKDMVDTMAEYDGRGLAAPQIAESIQVVVMLWDFDGPDQAKIVTLVNPELKPLTSETSAYWEGCLSLPGLRGLVARPNKVLVQGFNEKAEPVKFIAEGFAATVVQHECDHLLGKLYVDRMTDFTKFAFSREFDRYLAETEGPDAGEE